jgi:hypothetical protein
MTITIINKIIATLEHEDAPMIAAVLCLFAALIVPTLTGE